MAVRTNESDEQEKEIDRLASLPSVADLKADWPKDWIAERRELYLEDMSGKQWHFSFSPAKVTSSTETDGHGNRVRNVARCDVCRRVVNPDWRALRLHAYKHLFLNIPFDAVECPCPSPLK